MPREKVIRNVALPERIYEMMQATGKTNREVLSEAVQRYRKSIHRHLREAGFATADEEVEGPRKIVRLAVGLEDDSELQAIVDECGVDFVQVVLACLRNQFGLRLGDDERKELEAKPYRPKKQSGHTSR